MLATTAATAPPPAGTFHPLTVAEVSQLCADAVAITFDVPAGLADALRVPGLRVADAAPARRRPGGAPLVLDLRPGGRAAADRRARGAGRVVLPLAGRARSGRATRSRSAPRPGRFTPGTATAGHHVLIAAGPGITPVLSIAATVLRDPAATAAVLSATGTPAR